MPESKTGFAGTVHKLELLLFLKNSAKVEGR